MKERPLHLSGAMVLAFRKGLKTQARRWLKPQPNLSLLKDPLAFLEWRRCPILGITHYPSEWGLYFKDSGPGDVPIHGYDCPWGQPGDELWIQETCRAVGGLDGKHGMGIVYQADRTFAPIDNTPEAQALWLKLYQYDYVRRGRPGLGGWIPWHHVPQWTSRDTAILKTVWIERLQDITEPDAYSEGISGGDWMGDPVGEFLKIWDSRHKAKWHGWEANDWVWVLDIKRKTEEEHVSDVATGWKYYSHVETTNPDTGEEWTEKDFDIPD